MNRLQLTDRVKVEILDNGRVAATYEGTGYHNVTDAIAAAYDSTTRTAKPAEDYVYRVTDLTTGSAARYRINAGGHVRILPEETAE